MRTKIMLYAALLLLGFSVPVWASPGSLPVPPARESDIPLMNESRQKPVTPPVPTRGQMLYENHCMACHESVVFIRDKQRIQSLKALRGKVSHWASYLHVGWGKDEVEEVVSHLNSQYYKFESR